MASEVKSQNITIIYGEPYTKHSWLPQRKEQAVAIINKAMATCGPLDRCGRCGQYHAEHDLRDGALCCANGGWYQPTKAQQLACTEPEKTAWRRMIGEEAQRDVLEMIKDATAHLSTIRGGFERNVMRDCHDLGFSCKACGMSWQSEIVDLYDVSDAIKRAAKAIEYTHRETQSFGERHWCSQCPAEGRMYDGLTADECLLNYQRQQHGNDQTWSPMRFAACGNGNLHHPFEPLTASQLAAARSQWSAELKKRQQEARAKERAQVVVDLECVDE